MNYYQDYIDLGFTRVDTADMIEFRRSGYYGFSLNKDLSHSMRVEVTSSDLNNPKLYIKDINSDINHILTMTVDSLTSFLHALPNKGYSSTAC